MNKTSQLMVVMALLLCLLPLCLVVVLWQQSRFVVQTSTPVVALSHDEAFVQAVLDEDVPVRGNQISFIGDIMLGRHVETLMNTYGVLYPSFALKSPFASSTYTVANFESAMVIPHVHTPNNVMRFSSPKTALPLLTHLGITHVSLANNHAFDYGVVGYETAEAELQNVGIIPFGHPTKLSTSTVTYLQVGTTTVALIGIHTLFVVPTAQEIRSVVEEVSTQSDFQIAYVHAGNEYEPVHSNAEKLLAATLVEAGIDLYIGHHPHVVQDIQLIQGVPVVYSLGNFIFDQYFSSAVQMGLIVDLQFDHGSTSLSLRPTIREDRAQPRLMTEKEKEQFLLSLARRSDEQLFEAIIASKITF